MVLLPAFLLACVQYGFVEEPDAPVPKLELSPGDVTLTGACDTEAVEVTATNVGTGPLRVLSATTTGQGWFVDGSGLPRELPPGESLALAVEGHHGEGELWVASTDPAAPLRNVPLVHTLNVAPVVNIVSPAEDAVIPEGEALVLEGFVTDADEVSSSMVAYWTSTEGGPIGEAVPAADGRVTLSWPAADRPFGPQTVQLAAWDRCGALGELTQYFCQDGPWTYDPLTFSAWTRQGTAVWAQDRLVVVEGADTTGAVFAVSENMDAERLTASIRFVAEGLRGLALVLLDVDRREGYLGGDRCGLGYGGGADCTGGPALPGWAVELDAEADAGVDVLAGPHVAWVLDGAVAAPAAEAPAPSWEGEHELLVALDGASVRVDLDGATILTAPLPGGWTWKGNLGITATTLEAGGRLELVSGSFTDSTCR